jgi:hypothetical protein
VFNNRYASTHGWIRLSCAYADKADGGKHLRQRTLGESLGIVGDVSIFTAFRDALSGLEYLHRARDLADRGLNLQLHAYQTHTFLHWRDLHADAAHPWGELCDSLAGRGVPSLDDALRDLQLRPVHEALRGTLDSTLAEAFASCAMMKDGAERSAAVASALGMVHHRAGVLLAEIERYAASGAGETAGIAAQHDWHGHATLAQSSLVDRLEASLRLPVLYGRIARSWAAEAHSVLPFGEASHATSAVVWRTVLGWCAVEALGRLQSPAHPEAAATAVFEALRLREPLAQAFAFPSAPGDEHWRSAARVRAAFAHSSPTSAPLSWIHDPDVAWLIGVHQHEGVGYFNKEDFERLLWWMALPDLLDIAREEHPDLGKLDTLREEIAERAHVAARGGYKVEMLEEFAAFGIRTREEKLEQQRQ